MSIRVWNIFLVFALIAALCAGGYFLYVTQSPEQMDAVPVAAKSERFDAPVQRGQDVDQAALMKAIESELNRFVQDIERESQTYKSRRTVVLELIQPVNLRAPDYIAENYHLAERSIMALQMQMNRILSVFSEADTRMERLINQLHSHETAHGQASASWVQMHDQQVNDYITFFAKDQDLFYEIRELLAYYYTHRSEIVFDLENNRVSFQDIEKQAEAFQRLKRIEESIQEQRSFAEKP